MFVLRRLQNMHLLLLMGGAMLCMVLMIQVKQIYDNNQKYHRYLGYRQYIEEISADMNAIERTANKSSAYVRHLNEALLKHREKEMKNASTSRMAVPS